MLKDGFDKNGYPAVVFMIANKKFDSKHPFSDELIAKEMDIVKKNYEFVAETVPATSADIVKIGQKLAEMGYEAHLWLCGDDREAQFKRQAENPKYREQGQFPDDFTTYTGTGRTEGVSGTAVRNALKANDKEAFIKLVPKGVDKLFDDLKSEIDKVQESMNNLATYIKVFEAKHHVDTATVGDFYQWAVMGEGPDGKADVKSVNAEDCEGLLDNGWFDSFDTVEEIADFFKKNWDKQIKVKSDETFSDWEVSVKLDKKEYSAAFLSYFGDVIKESLNENTQSEELHHEIGLALQQFGNIKNGFKMAKEDDIKDAMYQAGFDYDEENSDDDKMVFVGEYIDTDYEVTLFIKDRVAGKVKISNFNEIEA